MNHGRMHKGALAAADATPGALGLHLRLLDGLDGDLLVRLLAPHREFLERPDVGLRLAGDVDGAWRRRFGRVLATGALPSELAETLYAVGDLSTAEGAHRLRDVAAEWGLPTLGDGGRRGHVNHAAMAYLEQRPLFDAAQERVVKGLAVNYHEWRASSSLRAVDPADDGGAGRFAAILTTYAQKWYEWDVEIFRGGSSAAVHVASTGQWHAARGTESTPSTKDAQQRDRGASGALVRDVLEVDLERGRLSVMASSETEPAVFRSAAGLFFFGNPRAFDLSVEVTAAPLIQRGGAALDATGTPGLVGVSLAALELAAPGTSDVQARYTGQDLGPQLGSLRHHFAAMEIESAALDVEVPGQSRVPRATLYPQQRELTFDARIPHAVLRALLVQQGFLTVLLREGAARTS
jgi:hypothetical protein